MRNKVKVLRAEYSVTQETLAKELGVTRATINALENDKYDPSLKLAFKLAKRFNTKVDDVFFGDE